MFVVMSLLAELHFEDGPRAKNRVHPRRYRPIKLIHSTRAAVP
jgi:hypothetical protein